MASSTGPAEGMAAADLPLGYWYPWAIDKHRTATQEKKCGDSNVGDLELRMVWTNKDGETPHPVKTWHSKAILDSLQSS